MFSSALQGELLQTHFERRCLSQSTWSLDRQGRQRVWRDKQRGRDVICIKTGTDSPDAPFPLILWPLSSDVLLFLSMEKG